jgi:CO/xanthine dehydrogenase Mo-binding subunit
MVHARVVLPPSVGAHLVSVDGFTTKPPGLIKVVRKGDFLAVVAEGEWQAIEAMSRIKATWNETPLLTGSGNVFGYLRTAPVKARANIGPQRGNVDTALAGAAKTVSAQYNFPGHYHGMIGPPCSVVNVQGDQATCWAGTQAPAGTQREVARILGIPSSNVRVIPVENSGAYGRMGTDDATPAAAYISQQVGKPVRLRWMREQEHGWAPSQPPSAFNFRAGVDSTGKIVAWDHRVMTWGLATNEHLPTYLMAGAAPVAGGAFMQAPGGGDVGTYSFDNMRVVGDTVEAQLRGTYMRSPYRIATNFAGEQFLDEIAAATGQDPIALRLRHLADNTDPYTLTSIKPRMTAILDAVKQASGWETRSSPGPGAASKSRIVTGRGIAIVASQRSAYIANVAQIEVDKKTGKVAVTKMTVAADGGQIVNPNGIRAQIEGATIYSTSRALKEQVVFDKSKVISRDWVTYPILRFSEVPQEINIVLLDRPTLSQAGSFDSGRMGTYVNSGIGEPPNTIVPAAIGNAFFDATGIRMRQPPFTPARVRAALKAAGK